MSQKLSLDDLLLFDNLNSPKNTNNNSNTGTNTNTTSPSTKAKSFTAHALDSLFQNQNFSSSNPKVNETAFGSSDVGLGITGADSLNKQDQFGNQPSKQIDETTSSIQGDEEDDFGDFVGEEDSGNSTPITYENRPTIPDLFSNLEPTQPTTNFELLKQPEITSKTSDNAHLNSTLKVLDTVSSLPNQDKILPQEAPLDTIIPIDSNQHDSFNESFDDFGDFQGQDDSFGDFIEHNPTKPVEQDQPTKIDHSLLTTRVPTKQATLLPEMDKTTPTIDSNNSLLFSDFTKPEAPKETSSKSSNTSRPVYEIQSRINELNSHDTDKTLGFGSHIETKTKPQAAQNDKETMPRTPDTLGNVVSGSWNDVLSARSGPGVGAVNAEVIKDIEQKSFEKSTNESKPVPATKKHALVKSHKGPEDLSSKLVYTKPLTELPTPLSASDSPISVDTQQASNGWDFDIFASPSPQKVINAHNKSLGTAFGLSTGSTSQTDLFSSSKDSKALEPGITNKFSSPATSLIDVFSGPASDSHRNSSSSLQNLSPALSLASLSLTPKPYIPSSPPCVSQSSVAGLDSTLADTPEPTETKPTVPLSLTSALESDFPKAKEKLANKHVEEEEEEEADDWGDFQDFDDPSSSRSPKHEKTHQLVSSNNTSTQPNVTPIEKSATPSGFIPSHKKAAFSTSSRLVLGNPKPKIASAGASIVPSAFNNIPSSIELLALFNSTVFYIADSLFDSLVPLSYTLKKRVLANPKTKEFLLGYLETVMVCAKIMAGRRRRLVTSDISELMSDFGPKVGTKSSKTTNTERNYEIIISELVELSDHRARESERVWSQEIAPRLRAANVAALVLGSSSYGSSPLSKSSSTFKDSSSEGGSTFAKSDAKRFKHLSVLAETGLQSGYLVNGGVIDKGLYKPHNSSSNSNNKDEDINDKSGSRCIVCGLEPWEEVNYLSLTLVAKHAKKKSIFSFGKSSSSHSHSKSKTSHSNNNVSNVGMEYRWSDDGLGHVTCLKFWEHKSTYGI